MKVLHLLHATIGAWFYGWALREICPLHKDVPFLVRRRHQLKDKARRLWA